MSATAADVREFVLEQLADPLSAVGQTPQDVPDDFDLLAEGVLDSFGLLELVLGLETRLGISLDLESIEPEDLTRIGPFSRYVAAQAAS